MRRFFEFFAVVCVAMLVGCNSGPKVEDGITVKAKVVKGGQPLTADMAALPPGADEMDPFEFLMVPTDSNGATEHVRGQYIGMYDATTGNLEFVGPGKGIPAGTYTLVINFVENMPGMGDDDDDGGEELVSELDPLNGEFAQGKSTMTFTIPADKVSGEHDLGTIDLDNPPSED